MFLPYPAKRYLLCSQWQEGGGGGWGDIEWVSSHFFTRVDLARFIMSRFLRSNDCSNNLNPVTLYNLFSRPTSKSILQGNCSQIYHLLKLYTKSHKIKICVLYIHSHHSKLSRVRKKITPILLPSTPTYPSSPYIPLLPLHSPLFLHSPLTPPLTSPFAPFLSFFFRYYPLSLLSKLTPYFHNFPFPALISNHFSSRSLPLLSLPNFPSLLLLLLHPLFSLNSPTCSSLSFFLLFYLLSLHPKLTLHFLNFPSPALISNHLHSLTFTFSTFPS